MIIWLFDCTSKLIWFPLIQGGVLGKIWSPQGPSWSSIGGPAQSELIKHKDLGFQLKTIVLHRISSEKKVMSVTAHPIGYQQQNIGFRALLLLQRMNRFGNLIFGAGPYYWTPVPTSKRRSFRIDVFHVFYSLYSSNFEANRCKTGKL